MLLRTELEKEARVRLGVSIPDPKIHLAFVQQPFFPFLAINPIPLHELAAQTKET